MELGLQDQGVVIVGGASGIGWAMVEAFAQEQARVAVIDIAPVPALSGFEGPVAVRADVTDYAAIQAAARELPPRLGRVDHVIYAAAVGSGKYGFPYWNLEPADWERVWRVNLLGAVHVAHAFGPLLSQQRRGTMLFLASVAGQIGSQTDPPYSASKAALINFAQCAAKDLAPYNVRVNTICPGMVRTPLNRSVWQAWAAQQSPETWQDYETWAAAKIARLIPLNRWQTPEDVAALAVFLASDRAANITGQTLNVDGGFVMHW
ncbi:MAG: SDR family oxidoreductase [Thermogemmata sp.]|uniref:SDR family oxidoreductase n=1 Tax=Thermogemmata fonticola TaxID=2755323 RepID=A0A7V8VDC7_9BACT|nr:SDR family oxidoreductase [Thermogemmata fonticola]MBA2225745.1 SDR family oxidoreductase [Thermogemmata fonticola]MCX8138917.1 SDR family oxidoreductase [Gemmataceae bacterium]